MSADLQQLPASILKQLKVFDQRIMYKTDMGAKNTLERNILCGRPHAATTTITTATPEATTTEQHMYARDLLSHARLANTLYSTLLSYKIDT